MTYQYKGVDIEISTGGQGKTLLLLHGWGCDHKIYDSFRALFESTYRVYAFDLPGFGASSEPESIWGTQEYVDMLRAFVLENGIENPTLMGHSFGGKISILYAAHNSVNRVVLIDAAGVVPRRTMQYYVKVYSFKFMRVACKILLPKAKAEAIINKRRDSAGSSDYSNATPKMRAILSKVVNEDLKSYMPKITAPVLLFWGNKDSATPIDDARTMKSLIPNSELTIASGCGHYSFLESRGLFEVIIKKFLKIN